MITTWLDSFQNKMLWSYLQIVEAFSSSCNYHTPFTPLVAFFSKEFVLSVYITNIKSIKVFEGTIYIHHLT